MTLVHIVHGKLIRFTKRWITTHLDGSFSKSLLWQWTINGSPCLWEPEETSSSGQPPNHSPSTRAFNWRLHDHVIILGARGFWLAVSRLFVLVCRGMSECILWSRFATVVSVSSQLALFFMIFGCSVDAWQRLTVLMWSNNSVSIFLNTVLSIPVSSKGYIDVWGQLTRDV